MLLQGIVGESVEITPRVLEEIRPSTITYHIAKRLIETRFRDAGEDLPVSLFGDAQRIVRRWIDEGYLIAKGVPIAAVTYLELADMAAERIYLACQRVAGRQATRQGDPRPLQPARLVALRQLHHLESLSACPTRASRRSMPSSATAHGRRSLRASSSATRTSLLM